MLGREAPSRRGHRMVEWLSFSLRAWDRRGGSVPADFIDRLVVAPGDPVAVEGGAQVRLLTVAMDEFAHGDTSADAGAQTEAFAEAVRDGLLRAAGWLAGQPAWVFEELRARGCVTDVFVGGCIDGDQFDLDLPPEFLRACG